MNGRPTQASPKRAMHRLKTAVLILLGLVALYFVYHLALSLMIRERINSIRRAGFPVTCAELDKWYARPPSGQNAADVYLEAFAHFDQWTNKLAESSLPTNFINNSECSSPPKLRRDLLPIVGMAKLPPRTDPLSTEMRQLVAEYLSDNAEALRLLHQAASMKSCRYPVNLSKGIEVRLPPLASLRQAERLLYLEAIFDSDRQQSEETVKSVVAALGVSQSLSQEPTLISYLVQLACQGMGLDCLERTLDRMNLTDGQLAELDVAVGRSENQRSLTRALVGERCLHDSVFQELRIGKIPPDDLGNLDDETYWIKPLWQLYEGVGLLDFDEIAFLDIMGQYVKATQLPAPQSITVAGRVDDEVKRLSRWHVCSRMLLGSLASTVRITERCDAKIRDARVAIAAERYRVANGKLPDQLSDLVPSLLPSVPVDPFDGKPLRYKKLAKGYVIYSVGEDREDNGGAEKNSEGSWYGKGTDITFTVER